MFATLSQNARRRTALIAGSTLALAASVSLIAAPQAQAKAKIKCKDLVGYAQVDPVKSHNEGKSMHLHQFFGNTKLLQLKDPSAATYGELSGQGTNCVNPSDSASYWTPVLKNKKTGATIPAQAFTAYYRSWDFKDQGAGEAFPPNTRLVATKHNWTCGNKENVAPSQTIPDCSGATGKPGSTLTAHVDFPSCWDGVLPKHSPGEVGDTNDNKHFAYRNGGACPAGFPHKMVSLRETVQFHYTGTG
ncbi:MAG TPA: DUF1996 domain-containing protein, partial [Segeticoccus sp.]|uniref:DUF1996 domain-containing protein n=1 Tax=Segeticoccus sp. TaxID=2706531 RepID=UPI002D7E52C7